MIVLKGLNTPIGRLEFSPSARTLLANSTWDPVGGALWSLPGGETCAGMPGVVGLAFAPDGESLAAYFNGPWQIQLGTVKTDTAHFIAGPRVAWQRQWPVVFRLSPDQRRLAGVSSLHQILWLSWPDLAALKPWPARGDNSGVVDLAFSPDGTLVAVFRSDGLTLHEGDGGRPLWTAPMKAGLFNGCLAWSPSGRWVAVGNGKRLWVFNAPDGAVVAEITQPSKFFLDVEFTPDGRFLASVSHEKTVKFFDTSSWALRHELAWNIGGLRAIAFSKDGMLAAAGGVREKIVVWDFDL